MKTIEQSDLSTRFEIAMEQAHLHLQPSVTSQKFTATCIIMIGTTAFLIKIMDGHVEDCTRTIPLFHASDFIIRGSLTAWESLWERVPPPGRNDIFALAKQKEMQIEGDMNMVFAHLQYIKDLIVLPRLQLAVRA